MFPIHACISGLIGLVGSGIGAWQKHKETQQSNAHEIEVLKQKQEYESALVKLQVPIEKLKLEQAYEYTNQSSEETERAFMDFSKATTKFRSGGGKLQAFTNFLNGATRPLLTYIDRVIFGLLLVWCIHCSYIGQEVVGEILFAILDLIIFENSFWFGHKHSGRLLQSVDRMRGIIKKKA